MQLLIDVITAASDSGKTTPVCDVVRPLRSVFEKCVLDTVVDYVSRCTVAAKPNLSVPFTAFRCINNTVCSTATD